MLRARELNPSLGHAQSHSREVLMRTAEVNERTPHVSVRLRRDRNMHARRAIIIELKYVPTGASAVCVIHIERARPRRSRFRAFCAFKSGQKCES